MIFVNNVDFAEKLHILLKDDGYKVAIIFGKMSKEERDEYIDKFRNGEISTIITTNLLSRGYEIDNIKLVINFDVPYWNENALIAPDFLNYMYRITRAGRFGDTGIALTLVDND